MFFICSHFRSYVVFCSIFTVLWLPLATLLGALADHLEPLAHHLSPLAHHLGSLRFPVRPLRAFRGALGLPSGRPLAVLTPLRPFGRAIASMDAAWTSQSTILERFLIKFESMFDNFLSNFAYSWRSMWPCFPIFVNELFGS